METFAIFFIIIHAAVVFGKSLRDDSQCNIVKSCSKSSSTVVSELDLLECILKPTADNFEGDCKKFASNYAREFFKDSVLRKALGPGCSDDIRTLASSCPKDQQLVFCILNFKDKFTDYYCQHLVQRLENVVASNFALIFNFNELCKTDSKRLCSSVNHYEYILEVFEDNAMLDCLQKRIDSIEDSACQQEILRISEIQGESFKLDNFLLSSCSLDRKKFCSHVSGFDPELTDVYKCLQEFINDPSMSSQCREQLFKKEKLISKDSKISRGLVRACREDIRKNKCRRMISDDKNVRLVQMLLCLENAAHNGTIIARECRSEMIRHRKSLMDDYRLSPEVVTKCAEDINEFCNNPERAGKTIHCLLEHSRPRGRKMKVVSAGCQRSLETLLKVIDAGEDWRVDPVLRRACGPVVRDLCDEIKGDSAKVMSCLMDNINSESMKIDCKNAVLQIQYFIARDFKLDPQLFEACHSDAVRVCHAKPAWHDDVNSMDPERGPLVLPCLYRYLYNGNGQTLKPACEEEVRRVMRQRAVKAELIPEVEDACIEELSSYCSDRTGVGEEMLCLQDKYSSLQPKCRVVIGNFTEAEARDVNLNPIVKKFCRPVINSYCKEESQSIRSDTNDIMSCLVKHKNDEDVKIFYKCRAAIEHFQLISLNDYHFTVAFKDACRPYVIHYCPKAHTKAQVVECLSEVIQNDTLKDERYKLSKECRYQLRAQLLQQREFIDLDPKLKNTCDKDIKTLCKKPNIKSSEVLECLEENINSLSSQCHKMVFRIEQHDFKDSSSDYTLLTTCKVMIKEYCKGNVSQALTCLKQFKDEPVFDNNCRSLVLRRMVEQSTDYRLNPALQRGCSQDIGKFCLNLLKNHLPDTEFEGKIVKCLKLKFRERKLRKECETQMSFVLKEAALNYKLNPLLRNLCTDEINDLCGTEVENEKRDNTGQVEECLKVAFLDGRISNRACKLEVAGLIEEAKADIHVDPLLHQACVLDIVKYCKDVPQGAGRILQCLQTVMASKKPRLSLNCQFKLSQRMEMFRNAELSINSELNDFGEIIDHVSKSSSKWYFVACLFSIVGMIFMLGLFCGQVSRRYTAIKNK